MITGRRGKGEMWWEQIANPTRHALWCWNGWRWRLDARLLWHGVHCSWWPVAKENEDENLTGHPDRFYEAHLFVFCQYKSTHATLGGQFLHWPQWWPRKVKGLGKHISAERDRSLSGRSNQTWQGGSLCLPSTIPSDGFNRVLFIPSIVLSSSSIMTTISILMILTTYQPALVATT